MTEPRSPEARVAVVILTLNEEANLSHALASVRGWADEMYVLDSFSTDRTVEIAREGGCAVVQNVFVDYASQRNFAIEHLPIRSEWILFVDADEWLPDDLKKEIRRVIAQHPAESGYRIKMRMMWMGKWIRRGYYPTWLLRLFRRGKGRWENRAVNEHMIVEGRIGYLDNDFIHEDRKGIGDWIAKHNRYATHEAAEQVRREAVSAREEIGARFWGTQTERKRWIRYKVWDRLPPLFRPFLYFAYRYIFTGAFLEGRAAFLFHFLHALWYPLLIDAKYLEMKRATRKASE